MLRTAPRERSVKRTREKRSDSLAPSLCACAAPIPIERTQRPQPFVLCVHFIALYGCVCVCVRIVHVLQRCESTNQRGGYKSRLHLSVIKVTYCKREVDSYFGICTHNHIHIHIHVGIVESHALASVALRHICTVHTRQRHITCVYNFPSK